MCDCIAKQNLNPFIRMSTRYKGNRFFVCVPVKKVPSYHLLNLIVVVTNCYDHLSFHYFTNHSNILHSLDDKIQHNKRMIKDDGRISSQHDINPQHTTTTRGSSTCSVKEDKVGMSHQEPPLLLLLPDSNLDRSTTRIHRMRSRVVPRESSIQESLWSDYSSDSSSSASSASFSERRRRRRQLLRLLQEERFVLQKEQFEVRRMFQIMIKMNNFSLESIRSDNNNNDDNVSTLSSLSGYETDDDYSASDDGVSTVVECNEIIEIKKLCTAVVDL